MWFVPGTVKKNVVVQSRQGDDGAETVQLLQPKVYMYTASNAWFWFLTLRRNRPKTITTVQQCHNIIRTKQAQPAEGS